MVNENVAKVETNNYLCGMVDFVNPDHYKTESGEVWELMIENFGLRAFLSFCDLNWYKYTMREGKKQTEDKDHDMAKAYWYFNKSNKIKNTIGFDR